MEKGTNNKKKYADIGLITLLFIFVFIMFCCLFAPFLEAIYRGEGVSLDAYSLIFDLTQHNYDFPFLIGTLIVVLFIYGLLIYSFVLLIKTIKGILVNKDIPDFKIHSIIMMVIVGVITILSGLTTLTSNSSGFNLGTGASAIVIFGVLTEIILIFRLSIYPYIDFETFENNRLNHKNNKHKNHSKEDVYVELEKLKELKDKDILTSEEYETKRKDLVAKL